MALSVAAALLLGLCAESTAHARRCSGDPVYDPGSNGPCYFAVTPFLPGGEATVKGKWFERMPFIDPQLSYLKDTADDGLDAYLWVRYTDGTETNEKWLARASGPGATVEVRWPFAPMIDSFSTRICLGPNTATCSDWRT
ncbi:hypothetical protein [Lentzea sp. NPDC051838]|uniref:hypothetical protein n=1 Tax=Lentzea sp. NPDC051838 TaxID=3154849 RepID=UPI0034183327